MVEKGTFIRYLCVEMVRKRQPLISGSFFHSYTHVVRHCRGTIWKRQCLKRLQLRKGCVKPFHSRKFPLVCGGTLSKGKDHCPGLPEWLHLLSLLPPRPPHTFFAGTKVFYRCFFFMLGENSTHQGGVGGGGVGAWLVLIRPTLPSW